jgi:glycosyltransferase involved in cell wall biosynthesis
MSVHNGAATLDLAVRSLLWQTFSDWQLLLIDDASNDESPAVYRRFNDPRIQVFREPLRKGLAARLNQCVRRADGKYVARMDADDIAYPERFQRQVEYLESHSEVDLLGNGALLFSSGDEVVGLYPVAETHEQICRRPWWGFPLAHPTWMGKRSWFTNHPYDEHIKKGQDQELLLRTWQTSRFACLKECLLAYRMNKPSWRRSAVGRAHYCDTLLSQVRDIKSAEAFLHGVGLHGLGLARDILVDFLNLSSVRGRQSVTLPTSGDVRRWHMVLESLQGQCASV